MRSLLLFSMRGFGTCNNQFEYYGKISFLAALTWTNRHLQYFAISHQKQKQKLLPVSSLFVPICQQLVCSWRFTKFPLNWDYEHRFRVHINLLCLTYASPLHAYSLVMNNKRRRTNRVRPSASPLINIYIRTGWKRANNDPFSPPLGLNDLYSVKVWPKIIKEGLSHSYALYLKEPLKGDYNVGISNSLIVDIKKCTV